MIDFLLEIGVEEFPPQFLKKTATDVSTRIEDLLKNQRIFYRSIRTIYTPRRFGALVLGLSRKQKPHVIEIQGPPKKIAFDKNNKPTEMLYGFMKSNDLMRNQIFVARTEKGEYVYGKKEAVGSTTEDILYNEIPKLLRSLEFPKTMIWENHDVRFPRPIRWIVALLDRRPLRFEYAGVKADRYSMPNHHFSFKPIRMEKPREYINFLRHGGVVVDPNERRKIILTKIRQTADKLKGKPIHDDEMIEAINSTTEYPEVVSGEFDARYLELPEEVLMSVLKAHGDLVWLKDTNKFICIFSAKKKALQNVHDGYVRVMAARLYDALFYYHNDLKQGLDNMLEQTKGMLWLKDLGTIYDKTTRLSQLAEVFKNEADLDMKALKLAASLCKADLFSQMVRDMEFTTLQGVMGSYYAKASNKPEKVIGAIKEHYLPKFVGDELPKSKEAAVLSICDKIDNVIGAFLSGHRPTSSYDPFGVRRNGYAILNLIDAFGFNISLATLLDKVLLLYNRQVDRKLITEFFNERMDRYFQDKGFRYDEIKAILTSWEGDVADAGMRAAALKKFRDKPDFAKLVIGQKRVRNILKGIKDFGSVTTGLLKEPAEKNLYDVGQGSEAKLNDLYETRNYSEILNLLLSVRPNIDKFFDDVMVMCDDEKLKKNRLALVNYINQIFVRFADFSQIVIEGEKT